MIFLYYAAIQLICAVSYVMVYQGILHQVFYSSMSILAFLLLFSPFVILILRLGIQNSRVSFQRFIRKNLIFYLLYIITLYVVKKSIVLGDYAIGFSMFNLYFELNQNIFSDFLMAYAYIFFDSVSAMLFFILLPNYFWIFSNHLIRQPALQ